MSDTPPDATPPPYNGWPSFKTLFDASRWLHWQTLLYVVAATATVAGVWKLLGQKDESFGPSDWQFWLAVVVAALPLVLAFFFNFIPARIKERREQANLGESLGPAKVDYFRLDPYGEVDKGRFSRADQAHVTALTYFRRCQLPYFYLVGVSGGGKSSVLAAYLIPELRIDALVVTLRGAGPPLARLREALLTNVWSESAAQRHKTDSPLDLVKSAGTHLQRDGRKLLLVYDQFEELLTAEPTPDSATALDLLREVVNDRCPNCRVILSFRLTCNPDLIRAEFPSIDGHNHFTVEPFAADPARSFLSGGFEGGIGQKLLDRVIAEVTAVEAEIYPRLRPFTLNMVGRMLAEHKSGQRLPIGPRPFADYVSRMLAQDDVKGLGPTLLRHLVNDQKQRVKLTVNALAGLVARDEAAVQACLDSLATPVRGLVRCLNPNEQTVGKREWEVSHDFIAALLGSILPGLLQKRPSFFQMARPWLAPASLLFWFASFFVVFPYVQRLEREAVIARLSSEYGLRVVDTGDPNVVAVRLIPEAKTPSLREAGPLLRKVAVTSLDASDCAELTDISGLEGVLTLQVLDLRGCIKLTDVDGLKGLTHLQTLNLRGCWELLNVDGLSGCLSLQTLDLRGCGKLTSVAPLRGCTDLRTLDLRSCEELTSVDSLKGLTQLQTLELNGCKKLTDVDALRGCTDLRKLDLRECEGLTSVDGLRGLTQLQTLDLHRCQKLTDVDVFKGLTHLETLDLGGCEKLTSVDPIRVCTSLRTLDLRWCENVTSVDALRGCPKLQTLHLRRCRKLASVDPLQGLTDLRELDLRECSGLTSVDAIGGLTHLQTLDLNGCENLTSVDSLKGLIHLQTLDLGGCGKLTSVAQLGGCISLQTLAIGGCDKLTDVDKLKGVTKARITR